MTSNTSTIPTSAQVALPVLSTSTPSQAMAWLPTQQHQQQQQQQTNGVKHESGAAPLFTAGALHPLLLSMANTGSANPFLACQPWGFPMLNPLFAPQITPTSSTTSGVSIPVLPSLVQQASFRKSSLSSSNTSVSSQEDSEERAPLPTSSSFSSSSSSFSTPAPVTASSPSSSSRPSKRPAPCSLADLATTAALLELGSCASSAPDTVVPTATSLPSSSSPTASFPSSLSPSSKKTKTEERTSLPIRTESPSQPAESAVDHQSSPTRGRHPCPVHKCKRVFSSAADLQSHSESHAAYRPYACPHEGCFARFGESNTLKRHIRVHSGEKPFVCSFKSCGKAFADRTNVRRHEMIHTGERPFVCPHDLCGKTFSRAFTLRKHMKTQHAYAQDGPEVTAAIALVKEQRRKRKISKQ